MADAAVSFAIENVGNFLIEEGKFLSGVRDQVEEMQVELEWMQCFLKDAEKRKGESHRVRNWVSQIRETTYDVEDLVERFVLKTALRNRKGVMNRIKKYAFSVNHASELHQVGSRIEGIKARLNTLRTRLQIFGIRELRVGGEEATAMTMSKRRRQDHTHILDHNVVGLDGKTTELVLRLLDAQEPSVVLVYGMGGLGKTTTAKKVYGDKRLKGHFSCFAWVYISQQFNPRQVWESILTQLSDQRIEEVGKIKDDDLTSRLCDLQKEKKCLIVIDDIWQNQDWDNLSTAFPYMERNNRSKILVTSRNEGVVSHGVYRTSLNVLDHKSSFELLKSTILFLGGPNHPLKENSSMNKSAQEMVKECAGLPLAIIVLGGILAPKHELREWKSVGVNIKSVLKRGEQKGNDGVTSVLKSSYDDLSYNLKTCFLYFSQYSEDEEIETTGIIQKWIGEGFVSASTEEEDETMEDVGEEYLNELVSRCMIQAGKRGHTGRVKTCRVHDLMRDLCISKAKEECFAHSINIRVENEGKHLEKAKSRRVCVFDGNKSSSELGESVSSYLKDISPQLRSIWLRLSDEAAMLIVKKLKLVRVLDLTGKLWHNRYKNLVGYISNLIHLRFLKLEAPALPASIGDLRCLQTLNMEKCDSYLEIPDSLWGMDQLRHLYLPKRSGCESSKQRVSDFWNLQTLVNFPPFKFNLEHNLSKFTNVRKLVITRMWEAFGKVLIRQEIVFNRLQSLTSGNLDLEAITRSSPNLYRLVGEGMISTRSCSIRWPSSLTKLDLKDFLLDESHVESLGKLQSLKVLFLGRDSFAGKEIIFHESDFPQLHHLLVGEMENLEAWVVHEGALPSLVRLEIDNCRKLETVPDGSQFLKQLKELHVNDMPYSFIQRLKRGPYWDKLSISYSNCD